MYFIEGKQPFPSTHLASKEGVLAIGGDLSADRLIEAYSKGIFPWFNPGSEILWWSPDPRFVLMVEDLKVSKSMRQILRRKSFEVTFDQAFDQVISDCRQIVRLGQEGTWITDEMECAYKELFKKGIAHSVEVWSNKELVGGLYGVNLGRVFFGESMFSHHSNASKYGFIVLVNHLRSHGYTMIDCQDYTNHLASLGARDIPRKEFEELLKNELPKKGVEGDWNSILID